MPTPTLTLTPTPIPTPTPAKTSVTVNLINGQIAMSFDEKALPQLEAHEQLTTPFYDDTMSVPFERVEYAVVSRGTVETVDNTDTLCVSCDGYYIYGIVGDGMVYSVGNTLDISSVEMSIFCSTEKIPDRTPLDNPTTMINITATSSDENVVTLAPAYPGMPMYTLNRHSSGTAIITVVANGCSKTITVTA